MKEQLYECIEDYQGGIFGMDRKYTLQEWKEQVFEWQELQTSPGELDEQEQAAIKIILNMGAEDLLTYIENFWDIRIVPVGSDEWNEFDKKYPVDEQGYRF